jgi:hypothetical protein
MAKSNKQQNLKMDDEETFETGDAITIPDGAYRGVIKDVWGEKTPQGYQYVQLGIELKEFPEANIRYGMPIPDGKPVTPKSKLGGFLETFGFEVTPGNNFTIKQIREAVSGKSISCLVKNEPSSRNQDISFASIVEGSIKPTK